MMYAQIVLFDGFDPLDVVAPLEVLVAGTTLANSTAPNSTAPNNTATGSGPAAGGPTDDSPAGKSPAGNGLTDDVPKGNNPTAAGLTDGGPKGNNPTAGCLTDGGPKGNNPTDDLTDGRPDGNSPVGGNWEVRLVSAEGPRRVVSGTLGLALDATAALDPDLPGYVLVPGASGPLDEIPALLAQAARSELAPLAAKAMANPEITMTTVCGGSLALAMAGLLAGRTAVTHVGGLDALRATGVTVVDARIVNDGDLITGAGVTSGLDLALHLLERSFGPRIAHEVEQLIQHERRGIVWR
ncbi:DJ-1/PfpI family protein [Actinoplanes couchii]|uniref:DJ-1/PfpI domain-containing protein n=1 Tax=Actinoplanes couchii TaxID=403638 RepID=A0ABQ3XFY2_9ACTN|nr:DJ-1/PfpI family protein [Actinoplanes couchii]MDR6320879.1 putative intracellular protease/amidase [Actinoplanes couchii]GID57391.1 hypothetical protein Aco03nite_057950 [Actinoplanes couchii]